MSGNLSHTGPFSGDGGLVAPQKECISTCECVEGAPCNYVVWVSMLCRRSRDQSAVSGRRRVQVDVGAFQVTYSVFSQPRQIQSLEGER